MSRSVAVTLRGLVAVTLVTALPAIWVSWAVAAPRKARVARIVFIGKAKACPCTLKKIAAAWRALKQGVGKRKIPVKLIQADRKPAEAARYKKKRAYKVLPAIYFVDKQGKVVDLLQGIVTTADVKQVLKGR